MSDLLPALIKFENVNERKPFIPCNLLFLAVTPQ